MIWYVLGALVTLILWMLVVVLVGLAREGSKQTNP